MTEQNKKTLLVVDDDQDIRLLLCDALSQKGDQVREAENGHQMWLHFNSRCFGRKKLTCISLLVFVNKGVKLLPFIDRGE
jgi:DNA-binding NtrC family response regulator